MPAPIVVEPQVYSIAGPSDTQHLPQYSHSQLPSLQSEWARASCRQSGLCQSGCDHSTSPSSPSVLSWLARAELGLGHFRNRLIYQMYHSWHESSHGWYCWSMFLPSFVAPGGSGTQSGHPGQRVLWTCSEEVVGWLPVVHHSCRYPMSAVLLLQARVLAIGG